MKERKRNCRQERERERKGKQGKRSEKEWDLCRRAVPGVCLNSGCRLAISWLAALTHKHCSPWTLQFMETCYLKKDNTKKSTWSDFSHMRGTGGVKPSAGSTAFSHTLILHCRISASHFRILDPISASSISTDPHIVYSSLDTRFLQAPSRFTFSGLTSLV